MSYSQNVVHYKPLDSDIDYDATSVSPSFDDDANLLGAIAVKRDETPQISCLFRNVFNTNYVVC